MRSPDVTLRSGDRLPVVRRTVTVDGSALDLSGYSATFTVAPLGGGTALIDAAAATIDPDQVANKGAISYSFTANDASIPAGVYAGWFEVTTSSKTLTIPNDGFLVVQVFAEQGAVWSYTGNPTLRPLDQVRFLINDTDPDSPKMNDAEIEWLLAQNGSAYYAGAAAAERLGASFTAQALTMKKVGDLSLSYDYASQAKAYGALAASLRSQAAVLSGGAPRAGGGTDRDPIFEVGAFDFPGTAQTPNSDDIPWLG